MRRFSTRFLAPIDFLKSPVLSVPGWGTQAHFPSLFSFYFSLFTANLSKHRLPPTPWIFSLRLSPPSLLTRFFHFFPMSSSLPGALFSVVLKKTSGRNW